MARQTLLVKVGAALDRFSPVRHLGVAVSGGPDSVALLSALVALTPKRGLRLTVLHANHALRPEAGQEQGLVASLCRRWQLPLVVETFTPPPSRSGIEAWARAERYRFFRTAREHHGLDVVALAHTLDDQAETVLFRLLRGSARRGLAGMPPIRDGWLVRPLLDCTRQEVMAYVTAQRLPYATDASNTDLRYARNKIRHLLLPFLEKEFSPQVRRRLAELAKRLRVEEEWLEALTTRAREQGQDGSLALSLDRLAAEPQALQARILRQWLEQSGLTHDIGYRHLENLQALTEGDGGRTVEVPGGWCVRREGGRLRLEKKGARPDAAPFCYALTPGREVLVPEAGWRVTLTAPFAWDGPPSLARVGDCWQALFDAATLPDALLVRSFRPGDRICPLGMAGRKKVHDILIDAKVPRARRRLLPLVVIGAEVAWVPGCVRGEPAKVTAATRWVCRAEVNPLPEK